MTKFHLIKAAGAADTTAQIIVGDLPQTISVEPGNYEIAAAERTDWQTVTVSPVEGQAPVALTAPGLSPSAPAPGDTVTITAGTYSGIPAPTVTGKLTLGGADVTADMLGTDYTIPADTADATALVWSETASNGVAPDVTQQASATVIAETVVDLTVSAGRVTHLTIPGSVVNAEVLSQPQEGSVSVNPDNTVAVVMTEFLPSVQSTRGFQLGVTYSDDTQGVISVDLTVDPATHEAGWGVGNHYMLETDASGNVIVETGEFHRKFYVSGSENALSKADIAALEGLSESAITGSWLRAHPQYGGIPEMALDEEAGRSVWLSFLGVPKVSSEWLLLERGYEYDMGQVFRRGARGEDPFHPVHITSYGEGERPVVTSYARMYQEASENVVVTDIVFSGGIQLLGAGTYKHKNVLFENVLVTNSGVNAQDLENITVYKSEIKNVAREEPSLSDWNAIGDRIQGIFADRVNGLLMEGNFIHHNGWADDYDPNGSGEYGQPPSMYSQNVYLQNTTTDVTLRDNIISQGASYGAQLRGGAYAEGNAFIDNNVAVNMLGGIYLSDGPIGNFTFFADNLITSAGHKFATDHTGALSWGIRNEAYETTLLDNIVVHLADPNNADEFSAKTGNAPENALVNVRDAFYDNTIVYNWLGSNYAEYSDLWNNAGVNGLTATALNQITIQNFAASWLNETPGAHPDNVLKAGYYQSGWIKELLDNARPTGLTARDVLDYFRAGFGLTALPTGTVTHHRFVPSVLADGVRWDNRINWTSNDVPDDGDNVDLGGNRVYYGARTTTINALGLGLGGRLKITSGKLTVNGPVTGTGHIDLSSCGQIDLAGALPATGSPSITVEAGRAILSVSQSTDADVTMTGGTLRFVGGSVLDTTGAVTLAGKIEVDTSSFASGTHTLISAGSLADNGAVLPVGVTLSGNSLMLVVT